MYLIEQGEFVGMCLETISPAGEHHGRTPNKQAARGEGVVQGLARQWTWLAGPIHQLNGNLNSHHEANHTISMHAQVNVVDQALSSTRFATEHVLISLESLLPQLAPPWYGRQRFGEG